MPDDSVNNIDIELERGCAAFLLREAEYLDDRRFGDWLGLLDPALQYKVPVRTTRENWDGDGISDRAFYMEEDYSSIDMRVKRLGSRFAWAESPATRTRRMVGNVRLGDGDPSAAGVAVRSNVAIFTYRGEVPQPIVLTAERFDRLVTRDGALRLIERTAVMDSAVLGLEALSIFI